MKKVSIRYQEVKDAKRFFDILKNPNFTYFYMGIKSVADEKNFIRANIAKRKINVHWHYTVLYGDEVVGGIGLRINQSRKYIGEIGYFLDEKYWGKGIATRAVKLIESDGFKKIGLSRIEILMRPENKASERVAIKSGYLKEGLLKKFVLDKRDGKKKDVWLYAKTL